MEKMFGIIRRTYYLIAVLITLGGIMGAIISGYTWYNEPKLQSWKFIEYSPKSIDSEYIELKGTTETVKIEYQGKLSVMTKQDQEKEIKSIEAQLWPSPTHDWLSIFLIIFLPIPLALIIHGIVHWIIWGKIK